MVLDTISDDFENVDQIILPTVSQYCGKLGFTVERGEVVGILALLVEDGMAKAYDLRNLSDDRNPFSGEITGMPPVDEVENDFRIYFYITERGLELHRSYGVWWPFDEEGDLLPGWAPEAQA
jgi:hypothetical protein